MRLAVGTPETWVSWWHAVWSAHSTTHSANGRAAWSWTGGEGWVGAEHAYTRTELGATERNHVLADVGGDNLPVLWVGVGQDVLNQVVSVLVASNVDEWNAWTIWATFAYTVKVAAEKLNTTNLETLLDDLGSELIHAVLGSVSDDMVDGAAAIGWSAVLADVLDAPVSKLAVRDDVDAAKDLLDTWALYDVRYVTNVDT